MKHSETIKTIPIADLPLWEKTSLKRTLLYLSLELTARCNNDCSHCYINLPSKDSAACQKELSLSEIKNIVDDAVNLGCLWVHLTGGEPLLRNDFRDIYMYLKKKGLLITLFTNASLISREHICLFKKYPPRDIEVSVYGVTEKTHRKVTGNTLFKETQKGINRLTNASLPVTLKATVIRSNFKELNKIAAYCHDKTTLPFRFDPFLHLRIDRNEKRNKRILEQRLTVKEIIAIEKNDRIRFDALKQTCADLSQNKTAGNSNGRLFQCGAGLNRACVSYDGKFQLCSALCHKQCIYDLREGTLNEAWKNFTPKILAKTSNRNSFKENCMACDISSFCSCCPAHADLETGELDGHVPYFCDMAKQRLQNILEGKRP